MPTRVASYEIMLNGSLKRSVLKTYENAIGDPTQMTERFLSNTVFFAKLRFVPFAEHVLAASVGQLKGSRNFCSRKISLLPTID